MGNSTRNTSIRVKENLKNNVKIIFLGGIFVALLFAAYNIVKTGMVKYKYTMAYQAEVSAFPHYIESDEDNSITTQLCEEIIFSEDFCESMQQCLTGIEEYDVYIKNISVSVVDNKVSIIYCADTMEKSKRVAGIVYDNFESVLQQYGTVSHFELVGDISSEKVKKKMEADVRLGITETIEAGMIIGMIISAICVTFSYILKRNIIDENDVKKYYKLPVLANIPPIMEREDSNEQTQD